MADSVPGKAAYFGRDLEAMSFAQNYHQWIIDEFRPYLKGRVAEVGAGTGNFSELLVQLPLEAHLAFEPSSNMYPHLLQRARQWPLSRTFNTPLQPVADHAESLDAVLYVNVLEHIEADAQELQQAYRMLKPGGHLLIFVPALSCLYSKFDRQLGHYRRYHKRPLTHLVKTAGFSIRSVKYFDFLGIFPWLVVFVWLRQTLTAGNVSLYDSWVVPLVRPIERRLPPPVGKNLILVGQKPG